MAFVATPMMTTATTVSSLTAHQSQFLWFGSSSCCRNVLTTPSSKSVFLSSVQYGLSWRTTSSRLIVANPSGTSFTIGPFNRPISALGSGLEASIADSEDNSVTVKNANIIVDSGDGDELKLRVDLTGDQTEIVFDKILTSLARTVPPIPGFRRQKGGKTSKVPKSFLIQMLGEERVTKFVIQEILNSTMADYVKKENLDVKDRKISTTETVEELKQLFKPGSEFGFNVIIEPKTS